MPTQSPELTAYVCISGLTAHPDRPFIVASCSRDSTVRLWSMTPLVQPLEINIIADRPWSEIIAAPGMIP